MKILSIIIFTFCVFSATIGQHTTIEYDSDKDYRPHLLLLEDDASDNEMARIWFKNVHDNDNFWTVGARSKAGSQDFDNTLDQNFAIAFNRNQKFAISKNGEVRINAAYILPVTDGSSGQVISTDGSGNLSWVNCCSDKIKSVEDFHKLKSYTKPPSCNAKGDENGKIIFDATNKKVKVCIDGRWKSL